MELPATSGLNVTSAQNGGAAGAATSADPATAQSVADRYLEALPLAATTRAALVRDAGIVAGDDDAAALAKLHHALAKLDPAQTMSLEGSAPAYASVGSRLDAAYGATRADAASVEPAAEPAPPLAHDSEGRIHLDTGPTPARRSMVPWPWVLGPIWRMRNAIHRWQHGGKAPVPYEKPDSPDPKGIWRFVGARRRLTLLALMIAQTIAATWAMSTVLPYHGHDWLEAIIIVLFAVLFCWVSAGFWTAITGFLLLAFHGDRFVISRRAAPDAVIPDDARTAIVMPICNEDVQRVFAGLRATYESLQRTGHLEHFDFFVLSDSGDPDLRTAEADAWLHLCRALDGFGRIFYRWRRHRVKRKSGNIDDFCRRWGGKYRYMIVLDADSVMSGDCLTRLVQLMEGAPSAGIIQTAPRAAGRDTLYARIQQFATRVYGPLFTAGLHYWQLGESHYWGHNAIIRLDPFIKHCALAPIPGKGSLSGEIMSHDFVEAALMRRAGWAVWIAYDLDGSYEEMPPNLLDELGRDRRWCHGNLMNFRLFGAPGFHRVHRAVFITGVMAYLSAPLWFLFLILSTALLAKHTLIAPEYFTQPRQLFPIWPEWHPEKAAALFSATATVLFLPKILSVLVLWAQGPKRFGGALHLALSMAIEAAFSVLAAPVRMLFHTRFVTAAFLGWKVHWKSPPREDAQTHWGDAVRRHGLHTVIGIVWAAIVYWLNPSFLWWLSPVVGALIVSIPLSVFSSRVSLGRRMRRLHLFMIPEEVRPPRELRATRKHLRNAPPTPDFRQAVVDPVTNALMCAVGTTRFPHDRRLLAVREATVRHALEVGPDKLTGKQKLVLLSDPFSLSALHLAVWSSSEHRAAWQA
ncbi:glucosyltransferase MdoH [Ralstonia sp. A12]|uniref:glucans biosynthesis glucosyltransferase MdoH n=1 Tax=Ralstonia sp. A12 TaxID=1217052 RepID=UPI000573834D|nr:glucans biosynthesis glucosyltransferase MdoH [Ralstonia sp. A12]KHK54145.1 glucosyltransferase MdoH [Ralstonia sp. A12]